jgi:hypothetical protein
MAEKPALATWLEAQGHGSLEALARRAGCSRATIAKLRDGFPCRVALARDVSAATDGAVSVAELLRLTDAERAS